MRSIKRPCIYFGLLGFLFSFGGPLGFYVHDYFFNNIQKQSFFEHLEYMHQEKLSTILYIGLGCAIFFSLFGFLIGRVQENISYHKNSKNELMRFFLKYMRISNCIAMEGLSFLRSDLLDTKEKNKLVNDLFGKFYKIDCDIENILDFTNEGDKKNITAKKFKELLDKNSSIYSINSILKTELGDEDVIFLAHEASICLAIGHIFEWASMCEFYEANITLIRSNSYTRVLINFPVAESMEEKFKSTLLLYILEMNKGTCEIGRNSISLSLPKKVA